MKHPLSDLVVFCAPYLVLGCACVGVYAAGCGAPQRPTVEQARAGLRLACTALAFAEVEGTSVPGEDVAALACDEKRTSAVMRQLVERAQKARQLATVPPEWLSPAPAGDAGVR